MLITRHIPPLFLSLDNVLIHISTAPRKDAQIHSRIWSCHGRAWVGTTDISCQSDCHNLYNHACLLSSKESIQTGDICWRLSRVTELYHYQHPVAKDIWPLQANISLQWITSCCKPYILKLTTKSIIHNMLIDCMTKNYEWHIYSCPERVQTAQDKHLLFKFGILTILW